MSQWLKIKFLALCFVPLKHIKVESVNIHSTNRRNDYSRLTEAIRVFIYTCPNIPCDISE